MSFYKEISPFLEYLHSIRKLKTYLSFDMLFPTKWGIPKSLIEEGQLVSFETEDKSKKGISFVTSMEESNVSITLGKVAKIIKLNKEKELKEFLFKQTVEQLKQTFEKTDLDKLQNLYFDFNDNSTELNIVDDENLGEYEPDTDHEESFEDNRE